VHWGTDDSLAPFAGRADETGAPGAMSRLPRALGGHACVAGIPVRPVARARRFGGGPGTGCGGLRGAGLDEPGRSSPRLTAVFGPWRGSYADVRYKRELRMLRRRIGDNSRVPAFRRGGPQSARGPRDVVMPAGVVADGAKGLAGVPEGRLRAVP